MCEPIGHKGLLTKQRLVRKAAHSTSAPLGGSSSLTPYPSHPSDFILPAFGTSTNLT